MDFREALRKWEAFAEDERRVWEASAGRAWGDGRLAAALAERAAAGRQAGWMSSDEAAARRARLDMQRGPAVDQA